VTAARSPWAELAGSLVRAGEQIDGIASREDTLARAEGHAQLGTLLEIALRWYPSPNSYDMALLGMAVVAAFALLPALKLQGAIAKRNPSPDAVREAEVAAVS